VPKTKLLEQNMSMALSFDDVLLVPQRSKVLSRSDVDLSTKITQELELKIPLISTNMDNITGVAMAIKMHELGGIGVLPRFESVESQVQKVKKVASVGAKVIASVGIKEGELERAEMLVLSGVSGLDVDVAHGHMSKAIDFTAMLKNKFGNKVAIIGGIASTGECAEDFYKAGADVVSVGIGGGSICSTRIQTGCGVPTLASLLDIAPIAKKYKKTFFPLAGIKNSGDIVKSLAAGSCAIRGGNIFSGTDEAPGDIIEIDGRYYKRYNGSTSEEEKIKQRNLGSNGKNKHYTIHIEGYEALVPYKGPVEDVVQRLLAGVRSGFSYCGASNIDELQRNATFIKITNAGISENGAHDVRVVK